ncbi:hypothetical protein RUM43_009060 [Polyplax serrata]|uniref:Uncharacterized protein n=1 Tax=Polyplax serrata TaxID=468196 RepID=A0AAN8S1T5_POLSC
MQRQWEWWTGNPTEYRLQAKTWAGCGIGSQTVHPEDQSRRQYFVIPTGGTPLSSAPAVDKGVLLRKYEFKRVDETIDSLELPPKQHSKGE